MRVLQINSIYGAKSTGLIMKDIHHTLLEFGVDSYVAYRDTTDDHVVNGIRVGNSLDWKLHALRMRIDGKQGYSSYFSTKVFINEIECIKPDIIHLHNIHSNFLNLQLVVNYAKKNRIPIVLTLHDCWYFTGKCYHFVDFGCDRWKTGCGECPKRMIDIPSLFCDSSSSVFKERKKLFDYDKLYVIGCSQWISSLAKQSPIFENARHSYIYNGVDLDVFTDSNEKSHTDNDGIIILVMANKWFEDKNKEIRDRILVSLKEYDRLIIVGCTNTQKRSLEQKTNVITYGYIKNRAELAKVYSQADVFLNVTHIDNLPTVNMEALGCGTPVITYNVGGCGELIQQGKTGYVVPLDDITTVLSSFDEIRHRKIIRRDCRLYAVEHFNKLDNYMKYLDLYTKIALDLKEE